MTARTGMYSKRFQPTAAQIRWLGMIKRGEMAAALYVNERPGVSFATIRACELAGWTGVDGHGNPTLTAMGLAALPQMETMG